MPLLVLAFEFAQVPPRPGETPSFISVKYVSFFPVTLKRLLSWSSLPPTWSRKDRNLLSHCRPTDGQKCCNSPWSFQGLFLVIHPDLSEMHIRSGCCPRLSGAHRWPHPQDPASLSLILSHLSHLFFPLFLPLRPQRQPPYSGLRTLTLDQTPVALLVLICASGLLLSPQSISYLHFKIRFNKTCFGSLSPPCLPA